MFTPIAGMIAGSSPTQGHPRGESRQLPPLVVVLLALLVVLALLYPEALLRGQVFLSSDAGNADAFRTVGDAVLATGEYPLWNSYLFAGMPTFGSLTYTRFLYPPTLLFDLLQGRLGFPPLTWMFTHLLFGGLGMAYLLSRWRLPVAALVLGALIWVLNPKIVAWGVHGHGSKLGAAMYLPWIVAWSWQVLAGRGARAVAVTGLLLGLQILRGHFQITYYSLLVVGSLALFAGLSPRGLQEKPVPAKWRWRRVLLLGGGMGLGFLLGAALLVPVHAYAPLSVRGVAASGGGAAYGYATGWSLAPAELPTLIFPSASGFGKATYQGLMPLVDYPNYYGLLLLGLALSAWWSGRRRLVLALAVIGVLALLVSLGRYGLFLYDMLYNYLPYFNKFRVPSMILILLGFAVAILAALGAATLTGKAAEDSRWRRRLPWIVVGVGILLLLLGGMEMLRGGYEDHLRALAQKSGKQPPPVLLAAAWELHRADLIRIGLILMVAGAALVYAGKNAMFRSRGLLSLLVVLAAFDLFSVDRRIVHPEASLREIAMDQNGRARIVSAGRLLHPYRSPQSNALRWGDLSALKARLGHDRLWPLGTNFDGRNDLMTEGIRSLDGYHPAKLAAYEQVRQRLRLRNTNRPAGRIASWLSGRVVSVGSQLNDSDLQFLRRLGADLVPEPFVSGRLPFYENRSAQPRARLLSRYSLVEALPGGDDLESFLDGVQSGSIPVDSLVVLDHHPNPVPSAAADSLPRPEFLSDSGNEVILSTLAPVPALLLLADMTVPGWHVQVDGQEAELLRADLILRAVALPAGKHEVRFYYRDPAVRRGLILSLVGLVCWLALMILPRWIPALRGGVSPHPVEGVRENG